jgi:hypothetical protein
MTIAKKVARALLDPLDVYDGPEQVLKDNDLSDDQKIEILRRWEYEASELSVAEDEGMPANGDAMLEQVLGALRQLVPDIDLETSPPTKQGGLDRNAVKPPSEKP